MIMLRRQTQHFDGLTARPIGTRLCFPAPTHGQHRMRMETLQTGSAGADGPQPGTGSWPDQLISLVSSIRDRKSVV